MKWLHQTLQQRNLSQWYLWMLDGYSLFIL